jgi:hypothetical protein
VIETFESDQPALGRGELVRREHPEILLRLIIKNDHTMLMNNLLGREDRSAQQELRNGDPSNPDAAIKRSWSLIETRNSRRLVVVT